MFEEMIDSIKKETVKMLFHVKVERAPERVRVAQETNAVHGDKPSAPVGPVRNLNKFGRNDVCPCGSGKKFKNCCGREA
ncbi:preprotein translocase subunit SecA [Clostridioides difficile]|nr:preprotein translocase subunit SecA [Clostridioides difficile]